MAVAAAAAPSVPGGCTPRPGPGAEPAADLPAYADLAAGHNARLDLIDDVYARGVIELRWTDDDGRHFEQGEADLWIEPPRRTALYISKFGERFTWMGSDETRSWLFDFRGDETTLYVARDGWVLEGTSASPLPIEPGMLLALCGLRPLPVSAAGPAVRREGGDLAVEPPGEPVRLRLEGGSRLPVRVEMLDAGGRVLFYSTIKHDRYERVERGASPIGPPFPTLIDIYSPDDRLHVKLSVRSPVAGEVRPRLFDLDALTDRFKPRRIEGLSPVATAP